MIVAVLLLVAAVLFFVDAFRGGLKAVGLTPLGLGLACVAALIYVAPLLGVRWGH